MKESRILKRVGCACAIFAVALSASGQTVYPPTVIVPVTYFDFHSDGSNPDFNPGNQSGNLVLPGMVLDSFDADGLPVGNSNAILYSWGIGKWWRSGPKARRLVMTGTIFSGHLYGPETGGGTVASA